MMYNKRSTLSNFAIAFGADRFRQREGFIGKHVEL